MVRGGEELSEVTDMIYGTAPVKIKPLNQIVFGETSVDGKIPAHPGSDHDPTPLSQKIRLESKTLLIMKVQPSPYEPTPTPS